MNQDLTAEEILRFLHIEVKKAGSSEWSVNCPFCVNAKGQPDFKGHMSVNKHKQIYHCHRCGQGGSLVGLYATLYNLPYSSRQEKGEAYQSLLCALHGTFQYEVQRPRAVRKKLVCNDFLTSDSHNIHQTYQALLHELTLSSFHEDLLLKRGFTHEEILRLGYRSAPLVGGRRIASHLLEKECDLSKVPGFFVTPTGEWDIVCVGSGIFIPQKNHEGKITGLQTRLDRPTSNKFFTFSGKDRQGGTPAKTSAHFAGLSFAEGEVTLTEGAMKADLASALTHQFFLSIPGVTQFTALKDALPTLIGENIFTVKLAFDMDKIKNPNVMNALERAMEIFFQAGFTVYILDWEDHFKDISLKGIDDFYKGFSEGLPLKSPTLTPFNKMYNQS